MHVMTFIEENTQVLVFTIFSIIIVVVISVARLTTRIYDPKKSNYRTQPKIAYPAATGGLPVQVVYMPPGEPVQQIPPYLNAIPPQTFNAVPPYNGVVDDPRCALRQRQGQDETNLAGTLNGNFLTTALTNFVSRRADGSVYLSPIGPTRVEQGTVCPKDSLLRAPGSDSKANARKERKLQKIKHKKEQENKCKETVKEEKEEDEMKEVQEGNEIRNSEKQVSMIKDKERHVEMHTAPLPLISDKNSLLERGTKERKVKKTDDVVKSEKDKTQISKSSVSVQGEPVPKDAIFTSRARSLAMVRSAMPTKITNSGVHLDTFQTINTCCKNEKESYKFARKKSQERNAVKPGNDQTLLSKPFIVRRNSSLSDVSLSRSIDMSVNRFKGYDSEDIYRIRQCSSLSELSETYGILDSSISKRSKKSAQSGQVEKVIKPILVARNADSCAKEGTVKACTFMKCGAASQENVTRAPKPASKTEKSDKTNAKHVAAPKKKTFIKGIKRRHTFVGLETNKVMNPGLSEGDSKKKTKSTTTQNSGKKTPTKRPLKRSMSCVSRRGK